MIAQPKQPARKTNVKAVISLVFGITGLLTPALYVLVIKWLGWPDQCVGADPEACVVPILCALGFSSVAVFLGLGGLIFGILALASIRRSSVYQKGIWMAITGIILAILLCVLVRLFILHS